MRPCREGPRPPAAIRIQVVLSAQLQVFSEASTDVNDQWATDVTNKYVLRKVRVGPHDATEPVGCQPVVKRP